MAENLASELKRCVRDWSLEIQTVVTDGAANITVLPTLQWQSEVQDSCVFIASLIC